ncbi:hypothetical protein [Streptomyces sp. NPDC008150]|uniref:hypothetical protein n=1 Tax=Streptomyces sp. NPDC008150 TaxID=3364816 RepID=UPI0036E5BF3A
MSGRGGPDRPSSSVPFPSGEAGDGTARGADGLDGARRGPAAAARTALADPLAGRGGADPVKALMHRHRELCEKAVDPLEIAAGLEAHGVTDRTAARFRHRDVFSLAEEMYARVTRPESPAPATRPDTPAPARLGWTVRTLLPGLLCAAAVTGLRLTHGRPCLMATAAGILAVALGVRAALRRGPLGAPATPPGTTTWTCWLVGYALLGDGLLSAAVRGGPDGLPDGTPGTPWTLTPAPVLALAFAFVPAAWCAHLFAVHARRRLTASHGLRDFTASVRPLLFGTLALFLCSLVLLLAASGAVLGTPAYYAQGIALGSLLLLARLLTVHGAPHTPTAVLTATGAVQLVALSTVFAGRLPGCAFLAVPVRSVVDAWGPGGVPALTCGAAALVLLTHADRTLTRASSHARTPAGR